MHLLFDFSQLVLAAALGFGGGWAAVMVDRRHRKKEAQLAVEAALAKEIELAKEADWAVTWLHGNTWVLANTGTAKARAVRVQFEQFTLAQSHVRESIYEAEEASFIGSPQGAAAAALISWTNPRGERVGPVRRAIPPKSPTQISEDDPAYRTSVLRADNQTRALRPKSIPSKISYRTAPRERSRARFTPRKGNSE